MQIVKTPQVPKPGQRAGYIAQAMDPDGAISKVEWDPDDDGQLDDATTGSLRIAYPAWTRTIQVRATDERGARTAANTKVVVRKQGHERPRPRRPAGARRYTSAVSDPLVIEARADTSAGRLRQWLRGRRLMLSGILALVEVVGFLIWRPSAVLMATLAVVLLVVCVAGATRLPAGLLRDVLWIIAIAQGIVVVIPLVVGLSLVAALVVAIALIVSLVAVAARWRL